MDSKITDEQIENPFTEIFQILSTSFFMPHQLTNLAHNTNQLTTIHQHAENATDLLLSGLQDLGSLMGIAKQLKQASFQHLYNLEFLIAALANLLIALGTLKANTSFTLKQQGIIADS